MSLDLERIYALLPAIYRSRDDEQGFPLKALLAVIAEQVAVLEESLEQLYDDQFIETCAPWVVPYIGDLVGARQLHPIANTIVAQPRAVVANTIAYRRRKGTLSVLEQLARDVTGLDARAVEYFRRLATTQYLNHLRPDNLAFASLRRHLDLEDLGGPFDHFAYTAEVRRIEPGRGRYNIPNIGIFLWRVQSHAIEGGTAREVAEGSYTFHPLGIDTPLYNDLVPEPDIAHLATKANVPLPLSRRVLYAETEALRQAIADGMRPETTRARLVHFGLHSGPVVRVETVTTTERESIEPQQILICDLSGSPPWRRPPAEKTYTRPDGSSVSLPIGVAIDPMLGRLSFPEGGEFDRVEVSYRFGSALDIGGGPYARPLHGGQEQERLARVEVSTDAGAAGTVLAHIEREDDAVFVLPASYTLTVSPTVVLRPNQRLRLEAAPTARPVLEGLVTIETAEDAEIVVDGLFIAGGIVVQGTGKTRVVIRHCTVAPYVPPGFFGPVPASLQWQSDNGKGTLRIERSILDFVGISAQEVLFDCADSLMRFAVFTGGPVRISASTLGDVLNCREIDLIENSIIRGPVCARRLQQGCVRFSWLPFDSTVPRRYRCHPVDEALRIQPVFTSLRFGDPAFGQLDARCPREIREGADDEGEMGVSQFLQLSQRERNLRASVQEYLRFGLEAGIFYAS